MNMDERRKRVLFLCTGNSARSQMAESILRQIGADRFDVFSAGTDPRAAVHADALDTLTRHGMPTEGLTPKPVSAFEGQSFDYVITVCEKAQEQCPVFARADLIHWTFADPAAVEDARQRRRAFGDVFQGLSTRIRLLLVVSERA
jgi:protein-tyrosine-phosphatase